MSALVNLILEDIKILKGHPNASLEDKLTELLIVRDAASAAADEISAEWERALALSNGNS